MFLWLFKCLLYYVLILHNDKFSIQHVWNRVKKLRVCGGREGGQRGGLLGNTVYILNSN